jgi:tRNA-2-methylthio-N6-dimethylallyladenosine synthase
MKVYIETMGCQMNRLDSELVAASLRAAGHEMVADRGAAEVVLYNTCSVRQHAEEKVYSRIGGARRQKANRGPRPILGVLGCMAQREGEQLIRRFGRVDIVCGPGQLARLPELIAAAAAGEKAVALDPDALEARREKMRTDHRGTEIQRVEEGDWLRSGTPLAVPTNVGIPAATDIDDFDSLDMAREIPPDGWPSNQAYVRVMKGCDNFCTYCIVPLVRGPELSRRPERIVQEIRRLVDAGVTEVTLLGQAVNRYRWSDGARTVRFSDLLGSVADVPHLRRLRFVTSHPLDFTDDILHVTAGRANICQYIHLPPQSGSDAVLGRMNRKYTRSQYDELVARARQIVPGVVLAGDFIVGFPGETEADHEASADLIRKSGFKNSFVFKYSPRPGTAAAKNMPDDVPDEVKRRRNNELLAVQEQVGLAHHRSYVGTTAEVLVEGQSVRAGKQGFEPSAERTQLVGRTMGDHIVHFLGPRSLTGQYVRVRIAEATSLALRGEMEEETISRGGLGAGFARK